MAIKIGVYRGTKLKEAEPIQNDLISSVDMAKARGKAFLDDNYYRKTEFSFDNPHKSHDVYPGKFIAVSSDKLGLSAAIMKITKYSIICDYTGLRASLTAVKYD